MIIQVLAISALYLIFNLPILIVRLIHTYRSVVTETIRVQLVDFPIDSCLVDVFNRFTEEDSSAFAFWTE